MFRRRFAGRIRTAWFKRITFAAAIRCGDRAVHFVGGDLMKAFQFFKLRTASRRVCVPLRFVCTASTGFMIERST